MLDRLYALLLRLLPRSFDRGDRDEMWATYRERVRHAGSGRGATVERFAEVADLAGAVAGAWWPFPSLESLRLDVRTAVRSLARSPLASGLATASLAMGIGATSALFSALDVWLVRPLPLANAERLVAVGMANVAQGWTNNAFSVRDYVEWADAAEGVTLAAYAGSSYNLVADGPVQRASALIASSNLPEVLGIRPALGRAFTPEEGREGGPRVALVTDGFWRTSLGGDPHVVGRDLVLNGIPHTIVGVLPPGQGVPGYRADLWTPLRVSGDEPRAGHFLWGVGLLRSGVTLEAARQELQAVASQVAVRDPEGTFPDARVRPFREELLGADSRDAILVLGGAALFVLLIACANIANILLARGLGRSHELAVRGTLGAGRGRLVQQMLVESLVLAAVGGLAGLAVGKVGIDLLLTYVLPADAVVGWGEIALNGRVLGVSAVLTILSALAFGLLPALRSSKVDLRERLAENGRDGSLQRRGRLGSALVVAEISASLVLVVLTGLMIRATLELQRVDMGLRIHDALVFQLDLPQASYPTDERLDAFYAELRDRVEAVPGVEGMAVLSGHPLQQWSTTLYSIDGIESQDGRSRLSAEYRRVTPSYLEVMGLRLLAGRWLDRATDVRDGPRVVVVSRILADRWWPTPAEALGQRIELDGSTRLVVGVVESARLRGPGREPPPVIFESFDQSPARYAFVVVNASGSEQSLAAAIRGAVGAVDPDLAVFGLRTMERVLSDAMGPQRAGVRILGGLGALALLLMLVGVYGVVAHTVGRRRQEMGLRLALGAEASGVVAMVVRSNAKLAAVGLAIGVPVSLGAGQGLAFLLAGVSPRDPVVLTVVGGALFLAILTASYLPARRAGRVDPVQTLRGD